MPLQAISDEPRVNRLIEAARAEGYSEKEILDYLLSKGYVRSEDSPSAKRAQALVLSEAHRQRMLAGGAVPTKGVDPQGPSGPLAAIGQATAESVKPLVSGALQAGATLARGGEFLGAVAGQESRPAILPPQILARQAMKTAGAVGKAVAPPLERAAARIRPERLTQDFWDQVAKEPIRTLAERGIEQVPQILGIMATSAISGGPYVAAYLLEAGDAYREAMSAGASEEEAVRAAGLTGLANMALEVKGVEQILKGIKGPKGETKRFLADAFKAMLAEGGTETVQAFFSKTSAFLNYLGDRGLSLRDIKSLFSEEVLREIGAEGVIGAVSGGGTVTIGAGISGRAVPDIEGMAPEEALAVRAESQSPPDAEDLLASEAQDPVGRPELANPLQDQGARDFRDAVIEESQRLHPLVQRHDERVRVEAQQRLASNGPEMEQNRFLEQGIKTDVDTAIARQLMEEASTRALETGRLEDLNRARSLTQKYYEEGTELARALRFRRDYSLPPAARQRQAVRDALLYPSQNLRKRLDAADSEESLVQAEELYAQEMALVRRKVREAGIDLERVLDPSRPSTQSDTRQMMEAVRIVSTLRATTPDRVLEYWRNAILSAPTTQMANFFGNTTFLLWEFGVQKPVEAAINAAFVGDPKLPQARGLLEAYKAAFDPRLFSKALRNALSAYSAESPVFSEQFGDVGARRVEAIKRGAHVAIPGRIGRVIRTPQRMLLAADEFAKTLIYGMSIHSQAQQLGKTPEERAQLVDSPSPDMVERAYQETLYLTFQQQLGKFGKGALRTRQSVPGTTFLMPFITTPANITKVSVRKSPLGIFRLLFKYSRQAVASYHPARDGSVYHYKKNERVRDLAEQMLAWGIGAFFLGLVGDEGQDDLPIITGSQSVIRGKRELQFRTMAPMSIRIPGTDNIRSYQRIEPLAFPLAFLVDTATRIRTLASGKADFENEWSEYLGTLTAIVRDKTFLKSLSDLMEGIEAAAQGRGADVFEYAGDFVTSFVPNIVKATGRASQKYLRDQRPSGQTPESWVADQGKIWAHQAFPFGESAPIRHDLWGRPIEPNTLSGHPASDFLWRLLIPIRAGEVDVTAPDRLLLNYNNRYPAEGYYPQMPQRSVIRRGKRIELTRDEYQEYARRSGQLAHRRIRQEIARGRLSVDRPRADTRKRVERLIQDARRETRERMFGR